MASKREKGTIKDWLKVIVLLLDEVAVIALVVVVLWVLKVKVPLPVAITVALLLGVVIFIVHKAVIPTFHKKHVTGAEGLVGCEGEVVEPLTPVGVIRVEGEYWKARSVGENIATGVDVEILAINRLTLEVKCKNR